MIQDLRPRIFRNINGIENCDSLPATEDLGKGEPAPLLPHGNPGTSMADATYKLYNCCSNFLFGQIVKFSGGVPQHTSATSKKARVFRFLQDTKTGHLLKLHHREV